MRVNVLTYYHLYENRMYTTTIMKVSPLNFDKTTKKKN